MSIPTYSVAAITSCNFRRMELDSADWLRIVSLPRSSSTFVLLVIPMNSKASLREMFQRWTSLNGSIVRPSIVGYAGSYFRSTPLRISAIKLPSAEVYAKPRHRTLEGDSASIAQDRNSGVHVLGPSRLRLQPGFAYWDGSVASPVQYGFHAHRLDGPTTYTKAHSSHFGSCIAMLVISLHSENVASSLFFVEVLSLSALRRARMEVR
ncbi:hypothetical protein SCHPADRAFT_895438 [Schizopora paradoxa]|uniref:Uncharacterized protein n=1 Tax=Schizopora paradoxa TaxID=27342 RepID=A0A0H2R3S6_9AGAM|nr:hypothetical protein SCHPADRAFT_895438 [Schizopora paradoxa]